MAATQFLGAFNDNLFKQLVLLIAVQQAAGVDGADRQWVAMLVFSLPFLLFSGVAGYVADRVSKRGVVVVAKVAEITIMLLGMAAFAARGETGFASLMAVLSLMGLQSAFFGPAKYGILPELLDEGDLPRANGIFLMTTFLAIIFGTAIAGVLLEYFGARLWVGSLACVFIAIAGTLTSLMIRRTPIAHPHLELHASSFTVPPDMRQLVRYDRSLLATLVAAAMFWLIGGIVQPAVNALGKLQLGISDTNTSFMAAAMGVGIAGGCLLAGKLSGDRIDFRLMRIGAWGIVATLLVLALPGADPSRHLLQFAGSVPVLVLLGAFAGFFVVPLQVYLQARPPADKKGRMIALMNQCSWLAIVLSALLYKIFDSVLLWLEWPRSGMFLFAAVLMVPVGIFYRPTCHEQPTDDRKPS